MKSGAIILPGRLAAAWAAWSHFPSGSFTPT